MMGRVEMRMYKRRQKRAKMLRRLLLGLLATTAVILLWRKLPGGFVAEHIASPTATPLTAAFDKTIESREVTLMAETWYAIQTGVFSTEEAAVQKADEYTERGAPGTVVHQGEKWRVFIACYGTEAEAASVRTRLEQNQRVETYLYAWECPELRLRLTGMVGQLDAAEAGFTLLTSTAAALRDHATTLDAGQMSAQEVHAALSAMDGQITLWEDTVHSRFGRETPALLEGMLAMTEDWDARYEALRNAESATALSAELKAQGMGMYDEICTWRRNLAAK